MNYVAHSFKIANKKGFANRIVCKPSLLLVGGTGIEPVTSTV